MVALSLFRARSRREALALAALVAALALPTAGAAGPSLVPVEGASHPVFAAMPAGGSVEVHARFGAPVVGGRGKVEGRLAASIAAWRGAQGIPEKRVEISAEQEALRIVLPASGAMEPALRALLAALAEEGRDVRELFVVPRGAGTNGKEPGPVLADPRQGRTERIEDPARWWQTSFATSGTAPLCEDPAFFALAVDSQLRPEVRGMPLYLEGLRIVYGNGPVELREQDVRAAEVADRLAHAFAIVFPEKVPVFIGSGGKVGGVVKIEGPAGRTGYSFAMDRQQAALSVRYAGAFRYREYEVMQALAHVIRGAELAPTVHWHRGDLYIFNLWER